VNSRRIYWGKTVSVKEVVKKRPEKPDTILLVKGDLDVFIRWPAIGEKTGGGNEKVNYYK